MQQAPREGPLPDRAGPPEAWGPLFRALRRARRPLDRFFEVEAASGLLLLLATAVALVLANSPWREAYAAFWHVPVGLHIGPLAFERSLDWVVNDVVMVVFFFVAGLEIRREIHAGELSSWQSAALPASAALGGMLVPAGCYLLLAGGAATRHGWGVPMATDIAFAVGILSLLGKRVPPGLRVLLLALAIIDDVGAILVIAIFYSSGVAVAGLVVAALAVLGIVLLQRSGVRSKLAYVAPAIVVWGGVAAAGVHPTIAGVIVGLLTPVRAWLGADGFVERLESLAPKQAEAGEPVLSGSELRETLGELVVIAREARSPAEGLLDALHPWVAFGIMPLFALANAGVSLSGLAVSGDSLRVLGGVFVGLVLGKPTGILLASCVVLRLGVASLPRGLGLRHLLVLGAVAGVGFTMAMLVAQLAFEAPAILATAKLGVLAASGFSAALALLAGRVLLPLPSKPPSERP